MKGQDGGGFVELTGKDFSYGPPVWIKVRRFSNQNTNFPFDLASFQSIFERSSRKGGRVFQIIF